MPFLHIPKFIVPPDLEQRIAWQVAHPRPLLKCPTCSYVLCSCGNCHSEECLQDCLYEQNEQGQASASTDSVDMSGHLKDLMNNRLED